MNNRAQKLFVSIMGAFAMVYLLSVSLSAHPINGEEFKFRQSDGTKVAVKVFGDEYYQRVESLDGYTLVRNNKGSICYARLDGSGNLVSTSQVYRGTTLSDDEAKSIGIKKGLSEDKNIVLKQVKEKHKEIYLNAPIEEEVLAASPTPLPSGVPVVATVTPSKVSGLVVLVDFPDVKSAVAADVIEQLFNKAGAGSVYDYFYNISGQKLEFTNRLIGFYTAKYEKSHYDSGTGYAGSTELLKETLAWLNSNPNFTTNGLTLNADKSIMAFTLLYAGTADAGWANGLWPHSGGFNYTFSNGVRVNSHQFSDIGTKPQTATINHECEHMILKWPDYYDYDGDSKVIGNFNNFANPYGRCVISKFYSIKWLNGLPAGSVVTVPAGTRDVLGYINPKNNNEMFIIENIRKKGDWARFPGEGLVIWHIDKKGNNSYQDMTASKHYITSIEQADGKFDMEKNVNSGDTGDFFHAANKNKFNDVTVPSSKWWDGTSSGFNISNISSIGDRMTFVLSNTADNVTLLPTSAFTVTPTSTSTPTITPTVTPTSTLKPTPTPTLKSTTTPIKMYKLSGYIAPDFNYPPESASILETGFKIELIGTSYSFTVTDNNGYFSFNDIPAGTYSVKISRKGFLERQISSITINGNVSLGTKDTPVLLWAGDIPANGIQDNIINMADLISLAKVFNTTSADQKYLAECDLNSDNAVNFSDVVIIAVHFNYGTTNYPEITPLSIY
jgi:M6 family metalloprotease-like protein